MINIAILGFGVVGGGVAELLTKNSAERLEMSSLSVKESLITVVLLTWCIFSFAGVSTFLYFNF